MDRKTFMAHVTHHTDQYMKKKKEIKEVSEALMTQLYKAQLG